MYGLFSKSYVPQEFYLRYMFCYGFALYTIILFQTIEWYYGLRAITVISKPRIEEKFNLNFIQIGHKKLHAKPVNQYCMPAKSKHVCPAKD